MTYDIWIALWQKFFSQNPREAFKQLIYIGYCGRFIDTVQIFKLKEKDLLKQQSKRKVFNVYVIGHHSFVSLNNTNIIVDKFLGSVHQARRRAS